MSFKRQTAQTVLTYAALDQMINKANDRFKRAVYDYASVHHARWAREFAERKATEDHAAQCEAAAECC